MSKPTAQERPSDATDQAVSDVRAALLAAQQELRHAAAGPVIVLLVGPETAGRGETADLLNAWMDPRGIVTRAWGKPSDEERERPSFWRYWRTLPSRGQIALFLSGWYGPPLLGRAERTIGKQAFDRRVARIAALERALADDGAVVVKCWLHVDHRTQRARLESLASDPLRRWRAGKSQKQRLNVHRRIVAAWKRAAAVTGTEQTPWHIIDAAHRHHRDLAVATRVLEGIHAALAVPARGKPTRPEPEPAAEVSVEDHLGALDLSLSIDRDRSRAELERQQGRLYRAQQRARERGVSTVVVFEGWDAGGKGGAIRRATAALDARYYRVIPIAAPTDEELAHHYLWRFWRHLARAGQIVIFDRSWYGRVLVERVEKLARPSEWQRAYHEIQHFEEQLVEHGTVVVKFWLHISRDEQLRRFRERERRSYKRWKITDEDWRNRRKWKAYAAAVNEMVARTSTRRAPWTLVEGNDKRFARLKVVRTMADRLKRAVPPPG
ncbi:MAG: polyphosphate:AMP phosphotransferase [Acidobacteria bacterium]|nr:polyphosphate:AMP phosphotransferase [Acidobacteriota bacterium]